MRKWMLISITISMLIASLSVAYYFVYYLPKQNIKPETEVMGVADMSSPTNTPTNTPTPTPTNKPRATTVPLPTNTPLPTPTPEVETESVYIEPKYFQCQKDKTNEIREANIERVEANQKIWDCTQKCFDDKFACEDRCKEVYAKDWDNKSLESCYDSCRLSKCSDACYSYIVQFASRTKILDSIIKDYCE